MKRWLGLGFGCWCVLALIAGCNTFDDPDDGVGDAGFGGPPVVSPAGRRGAPVFPMGAGSSAIPVSGTAAFGAGGIGAGGIGAGGIGAAATGAAGSGGRGGWQIIDAGLPDSDGGADDAGR